MHPTGHLSVVSALKKFSYYAFPSHLYLTSPRPALHLSTPSCRLPKQLYTRLQACGLNTKRVAPFSKSSPQHLVTKTELSYIRVQGGFPKRLNFCHYRYHLGRQEVKEGSKVVTRLGTFSISHVSEFLRSMK